MADMYKDAIVKLVKEGIHLEKVIEQVKKVCDLYEEKLREGTGGLEAETDYHAFRNEIRNYRTSFEEQVTGLCKAFKEKAERLA